MKTITLLIAFATASAALAVPPSDGISTILLTTRDDGQQLTNPGDEDPFTNEITGASIAKSRVLSGVGPPEADDRHFDWDESCTDEKHRKKITLAFRVMQELARGASEKLQDLMDNLPQERVGSKINAENRLYIAKTDFAYTQMFRAWDSKIDQVKGSFDKVLRNVKNFPGRAPADEGALRFICNADNHVKHEDGSPFCSDGAQAMTLIPQHTSSRNIEQRYSFTKSTSITFCPAFFDDNQFPNLEDVIGQHGTDLTLNEVDCAERIMLHEYMHIKWVDNLDPRPFDYIGYAKVAEHTKNAPSWKQIASMPDAFAWYALYSYFNNVNGGCGDAWPLGEKKPSVFA